MKCKPYIGHCPVFGCEFYGRLSGHHVFPRRFRKHWTRWQREYVQYLCVHHHQRFEYILECYERGASSDHRKRVMLDWSRYPFLFKEFLLGNLRA